MKALKHFTGVLILISLSVFSACSDNITSPLNSTSTENEMSVSGDKKRGDSYTSSFTLQPGAFIFLDSRVTSLKYITEYSISNCAISKKDLNITASNIDGLHSLPCSSKSYFLYDLMIENRSSEVRKIDVMLIGGSAK